MERERETTTCQQDAFICSYKQSFIHSIFTAIRRGLRQSGKGVGVNGVNLEVSGRLADLIKGVSAAKGVAGMENCVTVLVWCERGTQGVMMTCKIV
jgi:hypothetical protein